MKTPNVHGSAVSLPPEGAFAPLERSCGSKNA